MKGAEHGEQRRDGHGIAQLLLDQAAESEPDDARPGSVPRSTHQARRASGVMPAARQRAEPGARHREQLAAEVGDDGEQRADVHGDVEGEPLVLPAEQVRHQHEVARARDRQELGQALDDREDDGL